jgi:hypothetical protein
VGGVGWAGGESGSVRLGFRSLAMSVDHCCNQAIAIRMTNKTRPRGPGPKRDPRLSDSALQRTSRNRACERTKLFHVCRMPNRPSNWHVILVQRGGLMGPRAAAKKDAICPSCIPRNHRRGQEICAFPEETSNLCARDTADALLYPRAFGDIQPESAKADRAVDGFCRAKPPQPLHIAI